MLRDDLGMAEGKAYAQCGHAFVQSLLSALSLDPETVERYLADPPGTKVVLRVRTLAEMLRLKDAVAAAGLAHALIEDSGHVHPPHFDGSTSVVTALGIGPVPRLRAKPFLRRLPLA